MAEQYEIEEVLLGCLLTDPIKASLSEIKEFITITDFTDIDRQRIYAAFPPVMLKNDTPEKIIKYAFTRLTQGFDEITDAAEIERLKGYCRALRDGCMTALSGHDVALQMKEKLLEVQIHAAINALTDFKVQHGRN